MKCFQENICRLCSKTFCCKDCREQHEEQFHKVNPECEICIYGRMTIKNASVLLLNHIKTVHWPLHCVFCKKIFTSLDELVPHEKCAMKVDNLQITPKTPVTPISEHNEPSPMITPFYKCDATGKLVIHSNVSNLVTSTPLIHKEETGDGAEDKITPINNSETKCIYKSSLKLTGSSNLSDSKKSERRVTFSETPSVSEVSRKPKYLPLEECNDLLEADNSAESEDDSYTSVRDEDEIFKTVSTPGTFGEEKNMLKSVPSLDTFNEEKENMDNQISSASKKILDSDGNLWESALTNSSFGGSKKAESTDKVTNHFNLSLQINVFNDTPRSDISSIVNSSIASISVNRSTSLWASMTNMVKSVMTNISMSAHNSFNSVSIKRAQPDSDSEAPCYKRMKLTDIKCRRPIRDISPLYQIRMGGPRYVDKATQTDDPLI